MNPSDRLAIVIYEATISAERPFVQMTEIDSKLEAEGINCGAAAAVLIQRRLLDSAFGGAYALSPEGIAHVEQLLAH